MRTKNENVLRKKIWQEDLDSELKEYSAKGFDLRGITTIRTCRRRKGEAEQRYYRVVFERRQDDIADLSEQTSSEKESVTAK